MPAHRALVSSPPSSRSGTAGGGPVGPCGRDRQVLFDYHPKIRVILPTPDGVRNVKIADLMRHPLADQRIGQWET
jgi:cytidine deaminase